jgi:peroxiredoxin
MIAEGSKAPAFELEDQFGRKVSLAQFSGKRHVMLLYYPLDFTPT